MICVLFEERLAAIIADEADETVNFQSNGFGRDRDITSSWIESTTVAGEDLFDFSVYMDEVRRVMSQLCKDEPDSFSGSAYHPISCIIGASSSIFRQFRGSVCRRHRRRREL